MEPTTAVLVGAGLATTGWIYTARRARALSRKQHTVNVMLQATFNKDFQAAMATIRPCMRTGQCPADILQPEQEPLREAFRTVLNHFEFVAVGLRNGDLTRDWCATVSAASSSTCMASANP
jgi:hypothetical protein